MTTTGDLIRRSDVFRGLSEQQLAGVEALATEVTFREGEVIVEEDARGGRCYLLAKGRVEIEVRAPYAGREPHKLATIKGGEMFGELALVDGFLRSATARALEEGSALAFENRELEQLMDRDPSIGYRIMRNIANVLSQRMRATNMRLRNALTDILYY